MRDFLKSELKTLKAKTGLNQLENLSALPDSQNQIKILLDSIMLVFGEFHFIPDNDKKRIIQENIIRDQEFQGLNSRVVWRWLNAQKDKYYKELAHRESEEGAPPLTGEARDKAIAEWLQAVNKLEGAVTVKEDKYSEIRANWNPEKLKYDPLTPEEYKTRIHHVEYIRAMQKEFGTDDSKWDDEMEWIERNCLTPK